MGYFRGSTEPGCYRIGKNLATLFLRFTDPVMNGLYPQLSRLWANDRKKETRKLVFKLSKIIAFFAGGVILLATLFAPQIIYITVGLEYLPSALAMRIMV